MKWSKVWSTTSELEALGARDLLAAHGIETQILNQKDSMYIFIGELRLFVPEYIQEEARKVLTINGYLNDPAFLN